MSGTLRVMRRTARAAAVVLAAAFMVVAAVGGLAEGVGAHTEVQEASPGPAETVTPGLATVEVRFLDPVLPGVTLDVVDADGMPVDGLAEPAADTTGRTVAVTFAPLAAGTYEVRLQFVAEDGDAQSERYTFRVAEPETAEDDGVVDRRVLAGIATVIAGAGVAVIVARERRTSGDGTSGSEP